MELNNKADLEKLLTDELTKVDRYGRVVVSDDLETATLHANGKTVTRKLTKRVRDFILTAKDGETIFLTAGECYEREEPDAPGTWEE